MKTAEKKNRLDQSECEPVEQEMPPAVDDMDDRVDSPDINLVADDPEQYEGNMAAVEKLASEMDSASLESSDDVEPGQADVIDSGTEQLLSTPAGLRGAIEALLFSSPEPLTLLKISRALGFADRNLIAATLNELRLDYDTERRGIQITGTAAGYQMATREQYGDLILRLRNRKRRPALSPAALETLAIIAYRQPIIRAEIESIRGVESGGTIRNLIDMNLVEMVGRKEVLGRPPMYGTTQQFLASFGLRSLNELPPINELKRRMQEESEGQRTKDKGQMDSELQEQVGKFQEEEGI